MNGQNLKNSILQLAIQGKLVEQREEEGTAKELLDKIKEEKEQLIKEKKIKKDKSLQEITEDEIPFDIPENWEWVRLGDCVSHKSGVSYKKNNLEVISEDMIRVLRGGNISDLEYYFKDDDVMLDKSFVKSELLLKKNTLITPAVTSLQHIGKMARIDKNYTDVAVGGFVLMLIPNLNNDTFSQYLLFALSSHYHRSICRSITNKSGQAFYNLSREKLMKVLVPLPPQEEQKRIVTKIEEFMPYVEKYDKAYYEVVDMNKKFPEDMQKSILQYAIKGKLVEQREEEGTAEELYQQIQEEKKKLIKEGKIKKTKGLPEITEDEISFDIPESWKWVRLGEIGSWSAGATPSRSNPKYYGGGIPWLKTGDLNDGYITEVPEFISEEAIKKTSVRLNPVGSVLMAMYGATIGKLGILNIEATTNQACCACIPFEGIYNKFLFYYLMGQRSYYVKMGAGGAQPNISKEKIVNSILPLPPLAEQKRIVEKIEQLLPYTKQLVKKVD